MSVPQLISPLLDGFVMGDPISTHHGVRACPAMQLETDKKHIVKIISLPDTQSKLDALLLAGAYSDKDSALAYFKELADGVMDEAALLQKLARSEGFVAFDDWQMVPMDDGDTGYDIYLLSEYRPTLEGVLQNNALTHLQGINLGLDLCAALSVCRRNGFMYSNLKPSNIFICNEREFRIGDLGFLSLDSLQYASLPDKYRSEYTAPEISDAYSALNTTIDTYAVGLVLYRAYNDGKLPPIGMQPLPPCHADPALAEIILKACAVDPDERWQDPVQMGQALANYMQSNGVDDTPIAPPPPVEEIPEPEPIVEENDPEPTTEDVLAEVDEALSTAPVIAGTESAPEMPAEENAADAVSSDETEAEAEAPEEEETEAEVSADEESETEAAVEEEFQEAAVVEETEAEVSAEEESETEVQDAVEEPEDEVAQILAQADDLIAYQLPDPPVAPEPIDVSLPVEEEAPAEEPDTKPEAEAEPEPVVVSELPPESDIQNADNYAIPEEPEEQDEPKTSIMQRFTGFNKSLGILAIGLALVLALVAGCFVVYQNYYLQTIDSMYLYGSDDTLIVTLDTKADSSKLYVVCTDIYGNSQTARVEDGVAVFANLKSGTTYTVEVGMDGLHKLQGDISDIYISSAGTTVNGFYVTAGLDSTSAKLQFVVQGNDIDEWLVTVSTEGEEDKTIGFTGHQVTITGLTVGKEYTFTLSAKNGERVSGTVTTTYTAEGDAISDITVDDSVPGVLKVSWNAGNMLPEGGWMLVYSIDGTEQAPIFCQNKQGEILQIIPGAHYEISVTPADSSTTLVGTGVYDAPAAADFEGFDITKDDLAKPKMFEKDPNVFWKAAKLKDIYANSPSVDSYRSNQSAAIITTYGEKTSPQEKVNVTTLYVIHDSEGKLVITKTEVKTWGDMWNDRYGTFHIADLPDEVGQYTVDVYFDGAYAFSHTFEIVAGN